MEYIIEQIWRTWSVERIAKTVIDKMMVEHKLEDGDMVFVIVNAPDGPIYISVGELDYSKHQAEELKELIQNVESRLDNVKTLMDVCHWKGLSVDKYGMVVDG